MQKGYAIMKNGKVVQVLIGQTIPRALAYAALVKGEVKNCEFEYIGRGEVKNLVIL